MRIVKQRAVELLGLESRQLEVQCQRCERLAAKLAGCYLGGMSGKSVTAAEQRIRMQAAVVTAQVAMLQSIKEADARNAALVGSLPTTSPGVLDTQVAQERLDEARASIARFEKQMETAVTNAERFNALLSSCDPTLQYGGSTPGLIDICGLKAGYHSLIAGQEAIVSYNERVIEQAQQYKEQSAALYAGVNTATADQALASMRSYAGTGTWGDVTWAGRLRLDLDVASAKYAQTHKEKSPLERFLEGDLSVADSAVSGKREFGAVVAGIPVRSTLYGELLGVSASAKPYKRGGIEQGDDGKEEKKSSSGFEAEARVHAAQGTVTTEAGILGFSAKLTALSGSVTGALGASLLNEGTFAPSVTAKAGSKASVLSGEVSSKAGIEGFDYHAKTKGSFLTESVEAGISYGPEGFEAKLGSESYLATGELSTGFTFLGVSVDATTEAKVGGKGGDAAMSVTPTSLEGELGVGLGLGAGVKVKVDWSGLRKTLKRLGVDVNDWWRPSGVGGSKEEVR